MPQNSAALRAKTKNGLSWLFGIASLFVAGKSSAQGIPQEQGNRQTVQIPRDAESKENKVSEIIFPTDSLVLDSIGTKSELDEKNKKINFDSKNIKTPDKIPSDEKVVSVSGKKSSNEKIGIDSLLKLPVEEFVKKIQSPGGSRDVDEIFNLPNDEYVKYLNKALRAPTRTEVDTVHVHHANRFEKYGKFYDQFISDGLFYINLNLIKLNYYKAANDLPETQAVVEKRNSKIKSAWVHEDDHRRVWDYLKKVVATLSFEQICEIAIHAEIVARVSDEMKTSEEKNPNRIFEHVLDRASKTFYSYIRDKQFATDVAYMIDLANSQLNILEERGLVDQYPQIPYSKILKDIYTPNGECLLDKIPMKTQIELNEFINVVQDFDELADDLSSIKKTKKQEISNIKSKQKVLFSKKKDSKTVASAERGNQR